MVREKLKKARAVAPWNLGPWDLLGPCLQDFGGFRAFLPGVSQIMMLMQTVTRPKGLCLGLPLVFGPAPSLRLGRAWAQNSPKMA